MCNRNVTPIIIILFLFLTVLLSCSPKQSGQESGRAGAAEASPARGKRLYNFYCAGCHGQTGLGKGADDPAIIKSAPNIHLYAREHSDEEIANRILSGSFLGMPAHKNQMNDQDVRDVIRYIQYLSPE